MKRGAIIVLEGCDRCGKSTQCRKLVEELTKINVKTQLIRFPDRTTPVGQLINQYLMKSVEIPDKAIHLLFSANRWELEPRMTELIENGTTLVIDRYSYSGVAFSTAKHNMDAKWCWTMEVGLPKPDLVIFMQMSVNDAAQRSNYGDERYENKQFQEKVFSNFFKMKDHSWKVINAEGDIDTVHEQIMNYAREVIVNVSDKALERLS